MFKVSQPRAALILLSTTLALAGVSCSNDKTTTTVRENAQSVVSTPAPITAPASPESPTPTASLKPEEVKPNPYELAIDKAYGAFSISQSAQSSDDWNLVVSQWQEAIALMRAVPKSSAYKDIAQTKIAEYQRNLTYAKEQATRPIQKPEPVVPVMPALPPEPIVTTPPVVVEPSPPAPSPSQPLIYQAEIKRRAGGTPVIDVTFNGSQQFEMIVDTGASGTVITQQTATALGIVPVARAKANTASARSVEFPIGYVDSLAVGGALVKDVPVAIAGPELEVGLLGHDFFGEYDVTIKRDVVEFRPR